MCAGRITPTEVIFGVQYKWGFAPDQCSLVTYFQGDFPFNGVIWTGCGAILPARLEAGRGIQLTVIEQTETSSLPGKRTLQEVCVNLHILGLERTFLGQQMYPLEHDPQFVEPGIRLFIDTLTCQRESLFLCCTTYPKLGEAL